MPFAKSNDIITQPVGTIQPNFSTAHPNPFQRRAKWKAIGNICALHGNFWSKLFPRRSINIWTFLFLAPPPARPLAWWPSILVVMLEPQSSRHTLRNNTVATKTTFLVTFESPQAPTCNKPLFMCRGRPTKVITQVGVPNHISSTC